MTAPVPGHEGSQGPFQAQYGQRHVYARDVHSGAGNCVCGRNLGHQVHTEAAPGVPVPEALRHPHDPDAVTAAAAAVAEQARPGAVCQHCLADGTHTPIAWHLPEGQRCPVCGSAYSGPRRTDAYRVLLDAGLVARGE